MDQQLHSSPTQTMMYSDSNMFTEPHFIAYPDADECNVVKAASTSTARSPNTVVFAIDELSSVFRVTDNQDAIEHDSFVIQPTDEATLDSHNNGMLRRARYLTPSSFTTDGELSTFSEDTEEASDESSGSDDIDEQQHRFYPRRRRSTAMSIFRATNGTKRRCEYEQYDDVTIPAKRSCSAPMLCHANPIGSDDGFDDEVEELSLSSLSYYSFTSPSKRIFRSGNFTVDSTTAPSFTSLPPSTTSTLPAASNTLKHLQHPLSLETSAFAKLFPKNNEYQE